MANIDDIDKLLEQSYVAAKKIASPPGDDSQSTATAHPGSPKRSPERDRDSDRDRERERGSHRERRRSHEKDSRSRTPDRERRRRRDRSGSRSPDRKRSRNDDDRRERRRDDRDRRDRGDRDYDGDRRREDRDRRPRDGRDRDYDRDRRGSRRERERDDRRLDDKRKAVEALISEDVGDRDARTVFVSNLPLKADERDIREFFSKAGKVRDVRLITDRFSRKSKGFGYIELDTVAAISEAIQLSGTPFMGKTVVVQASQAEKNKNATTTTTTTVGPTRLYVGGLHHSITDQDVKDIFSQFGSIEFISLQKTQDGSSKGFAYVQFKAADSAKRALTQVNGQNLLGQALKVGLVHKNTPIEPQGRGGRGERGGRGGYGGSSYIAGEVDLDDDSSLSLNSSGRAALMAKLVHDNDLLNPQARRPTASQCLCLKNMFSLNDPDIGHPNFEQDLAGEIAEECSQYGQILHIKVDKRDPQGTVYLRFSREDAAARAFAGLDKRWFDEKQIEAQYMPLDTYLRRFPEAQ